MSFIKDLPNISRKSIVINSDDRTTGTNTNFTYNLSTTLTNVRMIELREIEYVDANFNINTDNNILYWTDGGGITHASSITADNYNAHDLAIEIGNTLKTDSTVTERYEVYMDSNKMKFVNNHNTFSLDFSTTTNSIATAIGLGATDYTGANSYDSILPPSLIKTNNIFISSTNLTTGAVDAYEASNGLTDVLFKFQTTGYGGVEYVAPKLTVRNQIASLATIDILLSDDSGTEIVQDDNGKIILGLDIYYKATSSYKI